LFAAFRLPTVWGIGWLVCATASAAVGIYGIKGDDLKSILLCRVGVASAITLFSIDCMLRGNEPASILFALPSGCLAISSLLSLKAFRVVQSVETSIKEQVATAFFKATRSDPAHTPGLIALQRATGLKLLLANKNAEYDYRLLFDQNLVFLIGINSFLGIRYSPRIKCIAPSRTFHLDVVGESWGGKRSKVRPMLGPDAIHHDLEITPEMLHKAREQMAQGAD